MTETTGFARSSRVSPGPRDWILDIFGSFVRDLGGWIAVADLLVLLDSLGVNEPSCRSALSRMTAQGDLRKSTRESARGYCLTNSAELWFQDGTVRIMETRPADDGQSWAIAAFSVPEEERSVRYQIRTRLHELGFGRLASGMMIAPASILPETQRALDRADLTRHIDIWKSTHLGFRKMEDIVASAWDLDAIRDRYHDYLELAADLDNRLEPPTNQEQFTRYMTHVNQWRELPFLDPGIHPRYLPADWPAGLARETFTRISTALRPGALRHYVEITTRSGHG